jgi:hypothetical protein
MPDVVAWSELDPLASAIFIECKGHGEPFKPEQEDWVWAALGAGVGLTERSPLRFFPSRLRACSTLTPSAPGWR